MLLIVEKGLNVECAMQYIEHWYTRANNKQIKDSNKGSESSYITYIKQKKCIIFQLYLNEYIIELRLEDLKYWLLNKSLKDYQYLLHKQVKADSSSENVLNEIRRIVHSFSWAK